MSVEENRENKVKIYPFIPVEMDADLIKRAEELNTSKGIEIEKDWQIARNLRHLQGLVQQNPLIDSLLGVPSRAPKGGKR